MPRASIDDPAVVEAELVAFLERFLASEDGATAAAAAAEHDGPATIELRIAEPGVVLTVDVAARAVAVGEADEPTAIAEIAARDLNDLLLERLGPVEISRLAEEGRARLDGPPTALAALFLLAGLMQPHYAPSLTARGRVDWLELPAPVTGEVWESAEKPPAVFGVRRPWQREQVKR